MLFAGLRVVINCLAVSAAYIAMTSQLISEQAHGKLSPAADMTGHCFMCVPAYELIFKFATISGGTAAKQPEVSELQAQGGLRIICSSVVNC